MRSLPCFSLPLSSPQSYYMTCPAAVYLLFIHARIPLMHWGRKKRSRGGKHWKKVEATATHYRDNNFRVSDTSKGGEGSLSCGGYDKQTEAARANVGFLFGFRRLETNSTSRVSGKEASLSFQHVAHSTTFPVAKRRVPETDASKRRNIGWTK